MASYKFLLLPANKRHDNSYPVSIRLTKDRRNRYIDTGLDATLEIWDATMQRYVCDKKLVPNFKDLNIRLSEIVIKIEKILRNFELEDLDWTLNQFETAFLNRSSKYKVKAYFENLIDTLNETGHHGNAICYKNTLHILEVFDTKFHNKVFSEIDIKFVKMFDVYLKKRGCKGNTRKYYFKALRACINKAIQDGEALQKTYPFGKGGFNISALEKETAKRYLPKDDMEAIKTTLMENPTMEMTRRLFLFSYYCYGISFIDAALLTNKNIFRYNGGRYIVYKRTKTKEARKVKPIQIKITDEIQELLDWFTANTILIGDYLLPIVSIKGYRGEQLSSHIRNRFGRNHKNLTNLAKQIGITDMRLTSYVSRHTMAMTLQDNQIPREVISQILGHSDLATTNTYLDSFGSSVIDEAAKVL